MWHIFWKDSIFTLLLWLTGYWDEEMLNTSYWPTHLNSTLKLLCNGVNERKQENNRHQSAAVSSCHFLTLTISYGQLCDKGLVFSCLAKEAAAVQPRVGSGSVRNGDGAGAAAAFAARAHYLPFVLWGVASPLQHVARSQHIYLVGLDPLPRDSLHLPRALKPMGECDIFSRFCNDVAVRWHSYLKTIWKEGNDQT